jgi:single-strand DNA-binding protein
MNKVILFGNLTRDPELKALPTGNQVCTFGVATNRRVKKGEQWENVAEFHNIVAWGRQAEVCAQYLKKGSSVLIEGRIQTRSWEKEGAGKQYKTEIVMENFEFGSKGSGAGTSGAAPRSTTSDTEGPQKAPSDDAIEYPSEDINPDDIPF